MCFFYPVVKPVTSSCDQRFFGDVGDFQNSGPIPSIACITFVSQARIRIWLYNLPHNPDICLYIPVGHCIIQCTLIGFCGLIHLELFCWVGLFSLQCIIIFALLNAYKEGHNRQSSNILTNLDFPYFTFTSDTISYMYLFQEN